jgi:hypothetical protein
MITKHFKFEEFTFSEIAARNGLDNIPDNTIAARLQGVAERMEFIRDKLDAPIIITSGYRSPQVNKSVGGSIHSAHCEGWAADFKSPTFGDPYTLALRVSGMGLIFDQIIHEYGQWVHISFDPRARLQLLTIFDGKTGYKTGIVTKDIYYSKENYTA